MDAREARAAANKRKDEIAAAMEKLHGRIERERIKTFQETVDRELKHWNCEIEAATKKGETYVSFMPPLNDPGEKIYQACKAALEAKGFRVSTYQTDEGYCIGDVTHISVHW